MIVQRIRAYDTALLPYQKPEVIRSEVEFLRNALDDIEHGAEAEKLEQENAELIAQAQAHAAKVIAGRRAAGKPGKRPPKRPKRARRIR